MMGRKWTDEELKFLKEEYPVCGSKPISKKLGRDYRAVQKQAQKMGIKRYDERKLYVSTQGYLIHEPVRGKKLLVHRLIMEQILGRPLSSDEIIHHIDGNKLNNHPSNLQIMTRSEHINHHRSDLKR
jgi:hypothetical protein